MLLFDFMRYFGGDTIHGVVELDVHKPIKNRGVRFLFTAYERSILHLLFLLSFFLSPLNSLSRAPFSMIILFLDDYVAFWSEGQNNTHSEKRVFLNLRFAVLFSPCPSSLHPSIPPSIPPSLPPISSFLLLHNDSFMLQARFNRCAESRKKACPCREH